MKLLRIVETPNGENGFERALEYDDRTIMFEKQRVTVQIDNKLYDWYGREIALGSNIKRIVKSFGSTTNGSSITEANETFIVLLKNGNLAIAQTECEQDGLDEKLSWHKNVLTGGMLNHRTKLITKGQYEFEREDIEIYETLVYQTFLKNMRFPAKLHVLSGVVNKYHMPELRERMTVFADGLTGWYSWQFHNFAKDRSTLMSTPTGEEPPKHSWTTTFVLGDITVSENGSKLSALSPIEEEDGSYRKISTDVEVLEHLGKQFGMSWYYDP